MSHGPSLQVNGTTKTLGVVVALESRFNDANLKLLRLKWRAKLRENLRFLTSDAAVLTFEHRKSILLWLLTEKHHKSCRH